MAHLKHKEWLHLGAIVEHGAVDDSGDVLRAVLEVLVVGGYHTRYAQFDEALHDGFRHSAAYLWFGAAAKLVDEEQTLRTGLAQHTAHVAQVTGVGTKVVIDALGIADVYIYVFEEPHDRALANGNGHTALRHILQQAHRL